jgi:hypothetical protein
MVGGIAILNKVAHKGLIEVVASGWRLERGKRVNQQIWKSKKVLSWDTTGRWEG